MSLVSRVTQLAQAIAADVKALNTALAAKLSAMRSYTDTATSGDAAQEKISLLIQPTADSTKVSTGEQVEVTYNSSNKILPGGYAVGRKTTMILTGSGTKDKAVVDMNQLAIAGGGTIDKLLSYEAIVSSIAADTFVNTYAAYYVPNLSVVPNIGNLLTMYAFSCDYTEAVTQHAGYYMNAAGAQYAPPYHPGLRPARYYSAPYNGLSPRTAAANVLEFSTVYVPHRTGVVELGFTVTTTGTATKARMALYQVANGNALGKALTAEIDVSTTGNKTASIAVRLDAGTYLIGLIFNGTCSINCYLQGGPLNNTPVFSGMWGATSPTDAGSAAILPYVNFTYGSLPTGFGLGALSFSANMVPHLWYRIST